MPDLQFKVAGIQPLDSPGASELGLKLEISNRCTDEQVHSIAIAVQLQIEPARRRYSDAEKQALNDLFGEPSRWPSTVRPLYWTTLKATVGAFVGSTEVELRIPRNLEPGFAATKYLSALEAGEVPILLLFSGRILYHTAASLQMCPIPWPQETIYRVPLNVIQRSGLGSAQSELAGRGAA